jgi:hypothetical protein
MRLAILAAALVAGLAGLAGLAGPAFAIPMDTVVLRALDKITGRVSTLEVGVGKTTRFGTLEITAWQCDKAPPEQKPESAAFLEIQEFQPDENPEERFTGWMLASSPALSALEHPVYDLWVIDCKNASTSSSETSQ